MNPEEKFNSLLRAGRVSPPLPPRFQENVWRRIETADTVAKTSSWLDIFAAAIIRPRLAFAAVAALICVGVLLGAQAGVHTAHRDAQARYVAYIAPNPLR